MILMTMGVEYGFMLLLVLSKYLRYQHFVLFGSCWLTITWQVLAEVYKHTRSFCGNLCDATSNLVKSSMYFYIHVANCYLVSYCLKPHVFYLFCPRSHVLQIPFSPFCR